MEEANRRGRHPQASNSRSTLITSGLSDMWEGLESPERSCTQKEAAWWEVETQEMQLLLEMLPEACGEGEIPWLLLSSHPPGFSRCLPLASLCRKPVDLAACWCWQSRERARNGVEGRQAQAQHQGLEFTFHLCEPDSPSG